MKALKITLGVIATLVLAFISFYACNCVFMVVVNYEALDIVSLAGIPMILMFINIMIAVVAGFRYVMREETDLYYARYYSIVVAAISVVGLAMSIFVGAGIYHNFVGDYIFKCYPLISLIVFALMIAGGVYLALKITKKIKAENIQKTYKCTFAYGLREAGLSLLVVYALERLGAFLLIPIYWSSYDSIYTLPYLFQLLIPSVVVITYIVHEYFLRNRKVTFIASVSTIGFSLITLIYIICMSKGNYPLTINSLSMILQLERLVTFPVDTILLYAISILLPFLNALNNGIMMLKDKKVKTN